MPLAARIDDDHRCPDHPPAPVATGCSSVIIGGKRAARVGDRIACDAAISSGEATVIIGGAEAARIGDPSSHGGAIQRGCPSVIIGSNAQVSALRAAAEDGAPFCEPCARAAERAKKDAEREGG